MVGSYYEKHKEEQKEASRLWRLNNPDKVKKNNQKFKESKKKYTEDNPEKRTETKRLSHLKHKISDNLKAIEYRRRLKDLLFTILGGKICVKCGFKSDDRALQFDHINDDGNEDRKNGIKSDRFYTYYTSHPKEAKLKLQVLCANCNTIKESERKQTLLNKSN